MENEQTKLGSAFRRHDRVWQSNLYVYPVIARRSRGVSIGLNVDPDKACNFGCVYCQVDRTLPLLTHKVDLVRLEAELVALLEAAQSGRLFESPPFDLLAPGARMVRDIAFSGDGEPTTFPRFKEAVEIAARARKRFGLLATKLVLITNAAYLTRPRVREALEVLDANNGEIWAKLDAGTEAYFEEINRPNVSLRMILDSILDAARARPVVIQTMWLRLRGDVPPSGEVEAYCERLNELLQAGARLSTLQLYTVARAPAEAYVAPLADVELDAIAAQVRERVAVPVEVYYDVA
jgi:wyosine [tRNA(Phe)-imidazoG37] synthetase (radical SAM superfamily)